jgi:3-oxoadipate enol-lactonase
MHFIRANGVTIHYQTQGLDTSKPVIAFANSLGTDFRIWQETMSLLAPDYAFVLHDKRGHGLSDDGQPPYAIADHINDMATLLDHLNLRQVIICGLSVGGLIAQGLYAARPDLVQALILCDTAHKIGTAEMWNGRIAAIRANGLESILDAVMERWFTPSFRRDDNAIYQGCRNMMARQSAEGYIGTCAAIRDADFTETAPAISVPALCIVGDQDGSTPPALVRALADLIPGSLFQTIADAGHIPCVEQPAAFATLIRAFLQHLPAGE